MKVLITVLAGFVFVFGVQQVIARPNNRVKRVSDSHLADLETKIALNNRIKGFAITMPVGAGKVDLLRIGRRRRSEARLLDAFLNQSDEEKNEPIPPDYNDYHYDYSNYPQ
ncbi:uncharacterized protein [Leptinotarsa decemlineata]|uniref:uncharacterized protein n=1 Tax=Leptinotarsa decemlineata TaxID=7539 RepID=UPI003D305DD4